MYRWTYKIAEESAVYLWDIETISPDLILIEKVYISWMLTRKTHKWFSVFKLIQHICHNDSWDYIARKKLWNVTFKGLMYFIIIIALTIVITLSIRSLQA